VQDKNLTAQTAFFFLLSKHVKLFEIQKDTPLFVKNNRPLLQLPFIARSDPSTSSGRAEQAKFFKSKF
jgi:hypothetical protein